MKGFIMRMLISMIAGIVMIGTIGMLFEVVGYVTDRFGAIGGMGLTLFGTSLIFAVATIKD